MRELKFRAYDVESECYIDEKDWAGITPEGRNIWIVEEEEVSVLPILGEFIIEQDTGLKDKNGKEIYEGDIVLHDKIMLADTDGFFGEEKNVPCVVKWDSIRTGYYPFNYYDTEWGRYTNGVDVEVIGNIHENKELLK